MRDDLAIHIVGAHDHLAADPVILQIVPDPLIGTQFGGIGHQEEEVQSRRDRGDELLHQRGLMGGVPVHDDAGRAEDVVEEGLQELDEDLRAHAPLSHHDPELPARGDRRVR